VAEEEAQALMAYETVIGLEVHAQMLTRSKIFCGCPTAFGAEPNTQTCPVCIGMPGVLPVLNRRALEFAVRTGLATNCAIARHSRFARKNYFYPDLPKGYQISQYELPICEHGHVEIAAEGGGLKRVGITRIHMEEDAGKNIHEEKGPYSLVDLNRTGVPLMEIVSEPDIRSPGEAVEYMKKLRMILRYLGVCDGNMEQGSLRCDANVSVRPEGSTELGVKVEVKNINSFKFVERALAYEAKRQARVLEEGGALVQETRLWDAERGVTSPMRTKEEAHDYRYFPEPDLVPLAVRAKWIEEIRASLPELPDAKRARFVNDYGLSEEDARMLTEERAMADWFEEAVKSGAKPKAAANWMMTELWKLLNQEGLDIAKCPLRPAQLAGMLKLVEDGTISGKIAKTVFDEMFRRSREIVLSVKSAKHKQIVSPVKALDIVKEKGLVQISDAGELEGAVDEALAANPGEVERYRGGEEKLMGFFVGQVMKLTKGKANPKLVNELLRKKLSS
jgi:aspartyl-tRNA(Asn)/glutamyl-tRNA(Gln) amidotransferase subunit B